jgi:TRAP-type uncharacterized transport system substrate-binding protein
VIKPRTWNFPESMKRRDRRRRLVGILAVAVLGLSAVLVFRTYRAAPPGVLTISAGNTEGFWHAFILNLARESMRDNLSLEPVLTSGTLDMLERVDRAELDFALIQGGYDLARFANVRQVAALSVQPVHLLVKPEYHDAVVRDFAQLRGKSINLGSGKRTGMYWLSREILSFAGLAPQDYHASGMTSEQLQAQRERDRLPDAIFIATRPPSELVRSLVVRFGYRLVPLPFGEAFRATALRPLVDVPPDGILIRKEHLLDAVIPPYSYDVSPPAPPRPNATLGTRVLLITYARTGNNQVIRLLDGLLASRYAQTVQPPLTADILRQPAEAPWHPGALEYRRRGDPLITGELIGILSNTLQIVLPFGGGILLVWGWLRARVLTDRERRIDRFIALVSGVEQRALQVGQADVPDRRVIHGLHRELSTIKDAALERIAAGQGGNALLVSSLFAHISDMRAYLAEPERTDPGGTEGVASGDSPSR